MPDALTRTPSYIGRPEFRNGTPAVQMTRTKALALSGALNLARGYIVDDIARIGRSRTMTNAAKQHDVSCLRDALQELQEFQAAHEEAHGLDTHL